MAADPSWIVLARQALPGQRIELGPMQVASAEWTPLRALADPRAWPRIARDYADGIGARSAVVGASCALQGLTARVLGPLIVGWALGRPVPTLVHEEVEVRLLDGRTRGARFGRAVPAPMPADRFATMLASLAGPLVAAVQAEFPLTERVLWGNIGASCAGALGAAHRISDDTEAVGRRAELLISGPWPVSLAVEPETCDGAWIYRRGTCCLIHLGENHRFCPGCSRVEPEDDLERWREKLGEPAR